MPLIKAFAGLRPQPGYAAQVAAPPYDVLNAEEARQRASGKPWSFLHISRPEIDLPADTDPYAPQVYAKGAENLQRMLAEGILGQDARPVYYLYRLTTCAERSPGLGDHTQTGLVAVASVADYDSNRIRKHEFTRPDKEDDRVRQIDALNAQTGPVLLAHKPDPVIGEVAERLTGQSAPAMEAVADDGVIHQLWLVEDARDIATLSARFDAMPALYIADGHHRSAAASRVAAARRAANPAHHGEEAYNYFLSVIFPSDQMKILDYNRVVKDLAGLSGERFLARLQENFTVQSSDRPVAPAGRGEFGMYLGGRWYRLTLRADTLDRVTDPVARLEVSLLTDYVLAPLLDIADLRRDKRIDFVGGIRGLGELEKRVDSGEMAVAFALRPTSLDDLMAVADANQVMPPKSTWFEPKLADGLVSHLL
jgi:uncharacterized protein (DUF1015 family)